MSAGKSAALDMLLSLKDEATGKLEGFNKTIEETKKKGEGLGGVLGGMLKVGAAAGAAAVLAVGAAAFKSAEALDGAYDSIRVGTGKSGAELEALKGTFKDVFTSIPTDADKAAAAISELNKRTGATGESLSGLAKPLLEASRLMGGDAAANAGLLARAMGDWSIPVEDGSVALDKFFKASQMTGVGMDSLMGKVVQFGSPLRLMGFTLDDSIALFSKWEKEGVNSELVMGSLRIAAGKFAKEGQPLRESLLGTFEAIQKNEDATAALTLGMEVFGARAGPDMVAAIREGRFAIDDLLVGLQDSNGAIMSAAEDTADFGEKFDVLRNKITVALEPLGMFLMDIVTKVADWAIPAFDQFMGLFENTEGSGLWTLTGILINLGGPLETLSEPLAKIVVAFGDLLSGATDLEGFFSTVQGSIGGLIQDLPLLAGQLVEWVSNALPGLAEKLGEFFNTMVNWVVDHLPGWVAALQELGLKLINWVVEALPGLMTNLGLYAGTLIRWIVQTIIYIAPKLLALAWSFFEWIQKDVLPNLPRWLGEILIAILRFIGGMLTAINPELGKVAKGIIDGLADGIRGVASFLGDAIDWLVNDVIIGSVKRLLGIQSPSTIMQTIGENIVKGAAGGIRGVASDLWSAWVDLWDGVLSRAKEKVNSIIDVINGLIDKWNGLSFHIPGFGVDIPSITVPGVGTIGGGHLGWGGVTIDTPDIGHIPHLAGGGIVTRPTLALIGERGPEAVIPLSRGAQGAGGKDLRDLTETLKAQTQALVDLIETLGGQTTADDMIREQNLLAALRPMG
jgi:TP901 family phage tail tape measure protein